MMIHNPFRQLSFARVGGEQWHWITTSPRYAEYSDCIYHDGAFYAMNRQGGIHRYTIAGSFASCEVIFMDTLPYTAYNVYIARASSGDVLQIWRYTDIQEEEPNEMHTNGFEIYKLNFDKQCIVQINTMGDDALFVGHSYTCCLSTKDYPKLLPGHVYFTDDSEYWLIENKNIRRDVGIYNLEDESSHDLVSPQTWLNWPNPIWITPSFTKINQ
uniref:KIB1-4 beta-propeller domain-containing protein n=1 Tax=Arundo donax TaxID=35708 RepID=A0A0A8ZGH2_ARUDO